MLSLFMNVRSRSISRSGRRKAQPNKYHRCPWSNCFVAVARTRCVGATAANGKKRRSSRSLRICVLGSFQHFRILRIITAASFCMYRYMYIYPHSLFFPPSFRPRLIHNRPPCEWARHPMRTNLQEIWSQYVQRRRDHRQRNGEKVRIWHGKQEIR